MQNLYAFPFLPYNSEFNYFGEIFEELTVAFQDDAF